MKAQIIKIAMAASLGLALTISCSSDASENASEAYFYDESSSSNANAIVSNCEGINFNTAVIGTQTWMAENLNCNVRGSKCNGNNESNCEKYGRLYDWATAMALPPSCNASSCASQINWNHKGICPTGWHIPTNEDLDNLMHYAGTRDGFYDSATANRYLKATNGWNNYGNGEDKYGFKALPGGYGDSDDNFAHAGSFGYFMGANEDDGIHAYILYMGHNDEDLYRGIHDKSFLFSVRCLRNNSSPPSSSSSYPSSSSSYNTPSSSSSYYSSSSYRSSSSTSTSGGTCASYYNAYYSCIQSTGNTSSCTSYVTAYTNCASACATTFSSCYSSCTSCYSSCYSAYTTCIGQ